MFSWWSIAPGPALDCNAIQLRALPSILLTWLGGGASVCPWKLSEDLCDPASHGCTLALPPLAVLTVASPCRSGQCEACRPAPFPSYFGHHYGRTGCKGTSNLYHSSPTSNPAWDHMRGNYMANPCQSDHKLYGMQQWKGSKSGRGGIPVVSSANCASIGLSLL